MPGGGPQGWRTYALLMARKAVALPALWLFCKQALAIGINR